LYNAAIVLSILAVKQKVAMSSTDIETKLASTRLTEKQLQLSVEVFNDIACTYVASCLVLLTLGSFDPAQQSD